MEGGLAGLAGGEGAAGVGFEDGEEVGGLEQRGFGLEGVLEKAPGVFVLFLDEVG